MKSSVTGAMGACAALMLGLIVTACGNPSAQADSAAAPSATAAANTAADATGNVVARGKYLVSAAACGDCHTPMKMGPNGPEPDESRALTGHPEQVGKLPPAKVIGEGWMWAGSATNTAFSGPWGVSYAANLTPDQNTGLGIWTEDMFIKAMRTGRHMGVSRPILPPMPWTSYRNFSDDDLKAMYAYLRSMRPVSNHVPAPETPAQATH
jgi:cytochrome c553